MPPALESNPLSVLPAPPPPLEWHEGSLNLLPGGGGFRGPCTQWATTGAPDAFCGAQGIRHPGSQPWGPCGTAPLFICAQGIQHPVGHRWGP